MKDDLLDNKNNDPVPRQRGNAFTLLSTINVCIILFISACHYFQIFRLLGNNQLQILYSYYFGVSIIALSISGIIFTFISFLRQESMKYLRWISGILNTMLFVLTFITVLYQIIYGL